MAFRNNAKFVSPWIREKLMSALSGLASDVLQPNVKKKLMSAIPEL